MKVAALAAVGNPADVVDGAVVARLHLGGIFDDLVNEITKMRTKPS